MNTAEKSKKEVVKGYKGFDKDLCCRGFQYEVGKEYKTENASLCDCGFHFCENPLDVLSYYPPADGVLNRFAEIQAAGLDAETAADSKRAATQIKIHAEIGLSGLIKAGVEYIMFKAKEVSNESGHQSVATNTGYQSVTINTGYKSVAKVDGKQVIAIATGAGSKAAGSLGCWIVLAEWGQDCNNERSIDEIKVAKVDGGKILADTYYTLINGEFVKAEQ